MTGSQHSGQGNICTACRGDGAWSGTDLKAYRFLQRNHFAWSREEHRLAAGATEDTTQDLGPQAITQRWPQGSDLYGPSVMTLWLLSRVARRSGWPQYNSPTVKV